MLTQKWAISFLVLLLAQFHFIVRASLWPSPLYIRGFKFSQSARPAGYVERIIGLRAKGKRPRKYSIGPENDRPQTNRLGPQQFPGVAASHKGNGNPRLHYLLPSANVSAVDALFHSQVVRIDKSTTWERVGVISSKSSRRSGRRSSPWSAGGCQSVGGRSF